MEKPQAYHRIVATLVDLRFSITLAGNHRAPWEGVCISIGNSAFQISGRLTPRNSTIILGSFFFPSPVRAKKKPGNLTVGGLMMDESDRDL